MQTKQKTNEVGSQRKYCKLYVRWIQRQQSFNFATKVICHAQFNMQTNHSTTLTAIRVVLPVEVVRSEWRHTTPGGQRCLHAAGPCV